VIPLKELYSFRISEKVRDEYEGICSKLNIQPKSYLRLLVSQETARIKTNLEKLKLRENKK